MSTMRSTDDRDLDSRRHRELLSHLKNITERVERIEERLTSTSSDEDPRAYNPERTELWPS